MKIRVSILAFLFAFAAISHVSYAADVGKHSGTKTELSSPTAVSVDFTITENVLYFTPSNDSVGVYVIENFERGNAKGYTANSFAIMPVPISLVFNKQGYAILKKSNYKNPYIDLRYRWMQEAWHNC